MNLRSLDLNLLPVFEAIYDERNLTRAGEALNMTQPAVSSALRRLREALGDPLFVRAGHGVAPTPVATSLIGSVRDALARLRSGLTLTREFDPARSAQTFHIHAGDVGMFTLGPRLAAVAASAPGIRFQFRHVLRKDVPAQLAAGSLDFAVDTAVAEKSDLRSSPFSSEPYVCALRRGHPLADEDLDLDALLGLRHLVVSSRVSGRTAADIALARLGRQLDTVMRFPTFSAAFRTLDGTDFALVAPESLVAAHGAVAKALPFETTPLRLRLYWRPEVESEPGYLWAREQLLGEAAAA